MANGCNYTCQCPCGYTGKYCNIQLNACYPDLNNATNPCLNGGVCINNHCNYSCQCTPGFTGSSCQISKNTCNPNNCANGATCVSSTNDYQCVCPCSYYSGKNCDVMRQTFISQIYQSIKFYVFSFKFYTNICSTQGFKCLNGGTCLSQGCSFQCACSQNYTGLYCDQLANPCLHNTCFNGCLLIHMSINFVLNLIKNIFCCFKRHLCTKFNQ